MFRRSGSFACFFVEGSVPNPQSPEFVAALLEQRFRTIEDAADEQSSAGWVTAGDPSGNTFEIEDMDQDTAIWLRMRIDKKSAPTKWLQIHRQVAEKSAGRRLSNAEKKDLKEDLMSKLMPRVLPSINLVDALYVPDEKIVLLFATSNAVREQFLSLVYKTFGASLMPADPFGLAASLKLDRDMMDALGQVAPINWPRSGQDGPPEAAPRPQRVAAEEPPATESEPAEEVESTATAESSETPESAPQPESVPQTGSGNAAESAEIHEPEAASSPGDETYADAEAGA